MKFLALACLALSCAACGDAITAPSKPPYVSLYNPQSTPRPLDACRVLRGVLYCPR